MNGGPLYRLPKPARLEAADGAHRGGGCTALYEIAEGERPFLAAAAFSHCHRAARAAGRAYGADRPAPGAGHKRLTGDGCAMLPARDIQFSRAAMSHDSVAAPGRAGLA